MKHKKAIILIGLMAMLLTFYQCFCPIVITDAPETIPPFLHNGDTITPLAQVEADCIIVVIDRKDVSALPTAIRHRRVLMTVDKNIIREFKYAFRFRVTGGDEATCESYICVYKDGKLILKTACVFDNERASIQNSATGRADVIAPDKLVNVLSRFSDCKAPFLWL